uniref:Protein kinase domain-containing protein n=1 Tax=Panagrolaimus sp. JU765 TaxID=591449 RepID=A0AC34R931_9BILA
MPGNNNATSPGSLPSLSALAQQDRVKPDEMPIGQILGNGQFKLMELVQNHPALGLTYNAINQKGDGFIVKVDAEANLLSFIRSEAGFLQAVNKAGKCEFFVEFIHGAKFKSWIYFVARFRPGPSINDCWCSSPSGKLTVGSASRVAYFYFKAIEVVHSLGYLLRRVDPNVIKFDASTRQIYLSDLSSIRLDPSKLQMELPAKWAGAPIYAPLVHHQGKPHSTRSDLEPVIYLLVEMTVGQLPWEGTPPDLLGSVKRRSVTKQTLFNDCPPQYAAIYQYISLLGDSDKIEFADIYSKLEEVWKSAGIKKVDDQFDWEERMKKFEQ